MPPPPPAISQCVFSGNAAGNISVGTLAASSLGGAIGLFTRVEASVQRSQFVGNSAGFYGGAVSVPYPPPVPEPPPPTHPLHPSTSCIA
jgi:hypothetical protein